MGLDRVPVWAHARCCLRILRLRSLPSRPMQSHAAHAHLPEPPPPHVCMHACTHTTRREYQRYWFFVNLQLSVDRALLALATRADPATPATITVRVKPFPWPPRSEDLGAASAAAALNLLLVYAFLAPTRGLVVDVVGEKELRLREGMRILGLTVRGLGGGRGGALLLLLHILSRVTCRCSCAAPLAGHINSNPPSAATRPTQPNQRQNVDRSWHTGAPGPSPTGPPSPLLAPSAPSPGSTPLLTAARRSCCCSTGCLRARWSRLATRSAPSFRLLGWLGRRVS